MVGIKFNREKILVRLWALLFIFSSCSLTKPNVRVSQSSYCAPPGPYVYDSTYLPLNDITSYLINDQKLLKKYSYQDWLLANASGSFFLLKELVNRGDSNPDDEDSIYCMIKKQQIFNRLLLASTELQSVAAELDCESERSKQLANYLDQINDTRVQKFTTLSVVTGAATAIVTSISTNHATQVSVGVNGSIISALCGGLSIFSSKKCIEVKHVRNLLADIWYKPKTSTVYPPFIWFVLNAKELNTGGTLSTIQSLKERWIEEGLINDLIKNKKEQLFFGTGGNYCADDLHTRTSMINQLKAEVRSINQNLQSFMLTLSV
jgi:hypothetical protein